MMMKYFPFYFTSCFILFVSCSKEKDIDELHARSAIIVYMAADNDLAEDAYADIRQMERGFEEKGVNLVVFIDPADDAPLIANYNTGNIKYYRQ